MRLHRPPPEAGARAKFAATRAELAAALVERDDEIELALTALIAREHLLLVGPPGCAKSLLLDGLLRWLAGGNKFSILLTKFTTPEEVVGPVSLSALKEDRRVTTGKLPEAHLSFVDELFKASSAILNTLLGILNEQRFENDGEVVTVPLLLCVAASNEWPPPDSGKELAALTDRFLFRAEVRPVRTRDGRRRLLWDRDHVPMLSTTITPAEVAQAHPEAMCLPWADDGKDALETIIRELAKEGVEPGDRRQFKAVAAAQASAWLAGADMVLPEHLEVLRHVLWDDPTEHPRIAAQVVARVANPAGMTVNQLLVECEQVAAGCDPKNLAGAATAAAKLADIEKLLGPLKPDPRVEKVRAHVKDQLKQLKRASLEAV